MKKYFFTGLVLLLPTILTIALFVFLFDFFTTPFVPLVSEIVQLIREHWSFTTLHGIDLLLIRLLALLFLIALIFALGVVARWFFIRQILQLTHQIFSRIPILKTVFNVSKDVFSALCGQGDKKVFQRPVMLPFPGLPNQSIGFIAGEVPKECQDFVEAPLVAVFAPTAPHPISGFLFLVPQTKLLEISMTNEDAIKYLVSCGLILPEET